MFKKSILPKLLYLMVFISTIAPSITNAGVPTSGLIAYYSFDGSINDESGNNHNPISTQGISYTTNRFTETSKSAAFSGTNGGDGINLGTDNVFNFGTNDFTYCFWMKTNKKAVSIIRKGFNGAEPGISTQIRSGDGRITFVVGSTSNSFAQSAGLRSSLDVSDNKWHFIACVFDKTNNRMRMYVDGQLNAAIKEYGGTMIGNELDISGLSSLSATSVKDLRIGNLENTSEFYAGSLDQLRFYSRAISSNEVWDLYQENCENIISTTPIITFNNENLAVTESTGSTYQWFFNNHKQLGETNSIFAGTLSAGNYAVKITNYSCEVSASYNLSTDQTLLNRGIVGKYNFDNDVLDYSGNNNHGTKMGGTFVQNRFFDNNKSLSFNRNNPDYVTVPRKVENNFTIAYWMKTTDPGQVSSGWIGGSSIVDAETWGCVKDFGTALIGNGILQFGIANTDECNPVGINSTKAVNDNKWHLVVATRDINTGDIKLYIDGQLNSTGNKHNLPLNSPSFIGIGGNSGNIENNAFNRKQNFYNGELDNLKIYNRVLNLSEISTLYSEECPGFSADFQYLSSYTPNGFATPTGTFKGGSFKPVSGLSINPQTGVIDLSNSSLGDYTIEYYVPAQYGCNEISKAANISIRTGYITEGFSINDCSNLPFYIPIKAENPVPSGVIGLDIVQTFDPAVMVPTGNFLVGSVINSLGTPTVEYVIDGSEIKIGISYEDNAELSGSGNVILMEFKLAAGAAVGNYPLAGADIIESYVIQVLTLKDQAKI